MLRPGTMRLKKMQSHLWGTHCLANTIFGIGSNSIPSQWIWPSSRHHFWAVVLTVYRTASLFLLPPFTELSFSKPHTFPHDVHSSCRPLTPPLTSPSLLLLLILCTCTGHCAVAEGKDIIYLHSPASPILDLRRKLSSKKQTVMHRGRNCAVWAPVGR